MLAICCLSLNSAADDCSEQEGQCSKLPDPKVSVNLEKKCMCINMSGSKKCFKIDIGTGGPDMTTSGPGKMHDAEGAKYQTRADVGTTNYDNDAIAMGIGANDSVGKWIHKTQGCSDGGKQATKGCIAVPCKHWTDLKKVFLESKSDSGPNLAVCGSNEGDPSVKYKKFDKNSKDSVETDLKAPSDLNRDAKDR